MYDGSMRSAFAVATVLIAVLAGACSPRTKTSGIGAGGATTASAGAGPSGGGSGTPVECDVVVPEVCNGVDDDCNGSVDDLSCEDGNPCTLDVCNGAMGCSHPNAPEGSACGIAMVCAGGLCVSNAACGNGSVDPGEECDDGNNLDGDGCQSMCKAPLPYPARTAMRVKALQPDFWPNFAEVAGNNTGGVAMNLVWANWEPTPQFPPCDSATQQEYDGHCYTVDLAVDQAIANWTALGLVVTSVVYGVPAWARTNHPCSPVSPGFDIFCSPDDAEDYGRFTGMIARRYDGLHGRGRIADFVIHNEVNANDWFDVGCGQGKPCDPDIWVETYAANWVAAFDRIVKDQPEARVLVSLDHRFGSEFDDPTANRPTLSGMTVLQGLAARVGARPWRVAFHPYPPNLLNPEFSPDDFPRVTYGNIGTLVGWLRKTFPNTPSSFTVELTESGVNSLAPSSQAAQANGVCASLRNVLGTPGIDNYVYHRMKDHPDETASGLGVGLHDALGQPKLAWSVWALANRDDLSPPELSCGFEDLPYTRVARSYHPQRGHWASSRVAPPGFAVEQTYRLLREEDAGTKLLYECRVGDHNVISTDPNCEGLLPLGPVGYVWTTQVPGTIPLFRCRIGAAKDHFISPAADCEGTIFEQALGYALP